MAISRIWSAFIIVSLFVASFKYFVTGNHKSIFNDMVVGKSGDTLKIEKLNIAQLPTLIKDSLGTKNGIVYKRINYIKVDSASIQTSRVQQANGIIETSKDAVTICIGLVGVMALFLGFLSIAEKAGGIRFLSRLIEPFFSKIFPEIPKGHASFGHMMMNFSANLLNLDNAATPFGIKAMQSLQEINPKKDVASNAQVMFMCLHASGLTLIPVSIIAAKATLKSNSPTDIFLPCMIATVVATLAALIFVSIRQKINLLQPAIIGSISVIVMLIVGLVLYLIKLDKESLESFSKLLSNGLILFIFFAIIIGALYKKIDIFDAFVDGAKSGFETAVKIIPYLVGMFVAICLLRNSGVFDVIIDALKSFFGALGFNTKFVDGLPTALVKPVSGSAARGMMIDTMKTFGTESFAGRLACILQGSSDTTLYVLAVYFGAINIKNTRYSIWVMLLADLVGIITSIALCYAFFPGAK